MHFEKEESDKLGVIRRVSLLGIHKRNAVFGFQVAIDSNQKGCSSLTTAS